MGKLGFFIDYTFAKSEGSKLPNCRPPKNTSYSRILKYRVFSELQFTHRNNCCVNSVVLLFIVFLIMQHEFLLYGANGYTGELIARHAMQYQLMPILAGRRREQVAPLAAKLGLPYRVFDMSDGGALLAALKEVKAVIHAAGPFEYTAKPMVLACLLTGTHYLDINGSIEVFEMIKQYDAAAKKAGVMLLPGAGFDVVPTDCIALQLKNLLPNAVRLQLAFATSGGSLSHGTATTMTEKLGDGGAERKDGEIVKVPLGKKGLWIDFGPKKLFVMSIPWGDVSTAWFTTGIPNIETYTGVPKKTFNLLKLQWLFNWLLRRSSIRKIIKNKINRRPAGPSDDQRTNARSMVWGQVINEEGKTATVRMSTPEGYTLTTHSALIIVQKILNGNFSPGYQTPASAYGENLVMEIPGVNREVLA
jgi:short subunit dehydrogenase-like uncharacterized protein